MTCEQTVVNPSPIRVADVRCANPLHHYLTSAVEWRVMSIMSSHSETAMNRAFHDSEWPGVSN